MGNHCIGGHRPESNSIGLSKHLSNEAGRKRMNTSNNEDFLVIVSKSWNVYFHAGNRN